MKKLFTLLLFTCLFATQGLFAQLNLMVPLPQDTNMIIGKLPNGITYYIRHNAEPKDRAEFYIIRDAGALLENDDQNGLAHFLEHMAFQGTKNFPGKGIITSLEKHGVAFGRDINAYTSQNETVYNLSSIPTTNEGLIDTCLLILHDWSYYLSLEDDEIDSERGVISEEWRTRRNSGFRIQSQITPAIMKGSKYAVRDVIGDLDVIKNFKYQTIRDFYHKWYRTDLEAIAIVGDFDVKKMEEKVQKLFSTIPAVENPEPRPFFDLPEHDEIYYCLATDKEAQDSKVTVVNVYKEPEATYKNTHAYLRDNIISNLYNQMIGARVNEILQKGNPPFVQGGIGHGGYIRGYMAYSSSATARPNQEDLALEAILTENERVIKHGFTPSELERAKTNTLVRLESAYKERDKTTNASYVSEMVPHFLEQEPIVDFGYYFEFTQFIMQTITAEEVSAKAKEWNNGKNMSIIISGPSENAKHLTKEEALAIMDKVKHADIAPYQDAVTNVSLISEKLKGSKIVSSKKLPELEAEEWTLANGAKVVFRKADYEKDDISLYAYSKGGTSLYNDINALPAAANAGTFASAYGVGDFDAITLRKMLAGKMASCGISIGDLSEIVSGASTPKDIETMLQLLYLRFENPRFDKEAHDAMINRNRALIANMEKNPQKIMQDSVSRIMTNYNPRTLLFNEAYLDQVTIDKVEAAYRDRIKDVSDFTFFIVGNIDAETLKPLVQQYIGSLKSEKRKETWKDNGVRGPKGKTVKVIEVPLETPKATVITQFSKDLKYSTHNTLCNNILKGILDLRYMENIREKEGGTYGVGVQSSVQKEPYNQYAMTMSFDCDPEKAEHLKSLIYVETEKMMKEGPTQEEVSKIVSNINKLREQSKAHNKYWMNVITTYYKDQINMNDPKNYENILNSITPENIQKFARELFSDANVVDITFVPKK